MTDPLHLPVVAPDQVARPTDRFRCVQYGATISADSCVKRQIRHGLRYWQCQACEMGQIVKARVGDAVDSTITHEERSRQRGYDAQAKRKAAMEPKYRRAWELRQTMSGEDVARRLGIPSGTASTWIHKGKLLAEQDKGAP